MSSERLIEIEKVGGLVVVRFLVPDIAEWDKTNQIWDSILELVDSDCHTMLFDLDGVQHSSSAFNGLLISAWKRLRSTDRRLAICAANANVDEVLRQFPFFEVFASREEALGRITSH